jgi:L-aminopeptidase/D-esterase-like protein
MWNAITDVVGIEVGHFSDLRNATGCTVILCRKGSVGGVDVRGSSPGTRETDLIRSENMVNEIHAILLSGGSAYGLAAATGVMRYLEEQGIGYRAGPTIVPIVPAAILFDLGMVTSKVRPGDPEGYEACIVASPNQVSEGTVGAGVGATVGKALGRSRSMKGGIGTSSLDMGNGLVVGAIVAVNAIGSVVDPKNGQFLAGPRAGDGSILDSFDIYANPDYSHITEPVTSPSLNNTAIGVVATSATLTQAQANKLSQMAHDGLAMSIRPCHTMQDGDVMFTMATGSIPAPPDMRRLCGVIPQLVALAVIRAIKTAESLAGIPSWSEVTGDA